MRLIRLLQLFAAIGLGGLLVNESVAQTQEGPPERLLELLEKAELELAKDMALCPALIVRVSPERPPQVPGSEAVGWVLMSLTVTTTGQVEHPKVIQSSLDSGFEEPALEAVAQFKFRPWVIDNKPRPFTNWIERIDFLSEGDLPGEAWPNPKDYFAIKCSE